MERLLDIVTLGRAARNTASQKIRQPLAEMFVQSAPLTDEETAILADELNIKRIEFVEDASGFISYQVKPQLRTLGPRYGKVLRSISAYLTGEGIGDQIVRTHAEGKDYEFEVDGERI